MGIFKKVVSITSIIVLLTGNYVCAQSKKIPAGWPESISGSTGFTELGKKIKEEPSFPRDGTDIEKARYIYLRLPDIVQAYGLKTGGVITGALIGLDRAYRFIRRSAQDPEAADSLKGPLKRGNCGEWSNAFSEILVGAGTGVGYVAYGDRIKSFTSPGFIGTATMVVVNEHLADGRISRRVFDPFNALYHSNDTPTSEILSQWGDLALTDEDRLERDVMKEGTSWQTRTGMPYIKDQRTRDLLEPLARKSRLDRAPSTIKPPRPTEKEIQEEEIQQGKEIVTYLSEAIRGVGGPWPARPCFVDEPVLFNLGFWFKGLSSREEPWVNAEMWVEGPENKVLDKVHSRLAVEDSPLKILRSEESFSKSGDYFLKYRIMADNFKTLEGEIPFVISPQGEIIEDASEIIPEKGTVGEPSKFSLIYRLGPNPALEKRKPATYATQVMEFITLCGEKGEIIKTLKDSRGEFVSVELGKPVNREFVETFLKPGIYSWRYFIEAYGYKTLEKKKYFRIKEKTGKEIVLVSPAQVRPKEGKIKTPFEFSLTYRLEDISPEERVEVTEQIVVVGLKTEKPVIKRSLPGITEKNRQVVLAPVKIWLAQPGKYRFKYTITAAGYKPLEGFSDEFSVLTEAEAPPAEPSREEAVRVEVKPEYIYVLEYIGYAGGPDAEAGMGSRIKVDNSLPAKNALSGKIAATQTSFAFGFAGKGGDWINSGPASAWGKLILSGLPAKVKPQERLKVTANVSGAGSWQVAEGDYKGKNFPAWFSLQGNREELTQIETLVAPEADAGRRWTETFQAACGAGNIISRIEITLHYRSFKVDSLPANLQVQDLVTYPEAPSQQTLTPQTPAQTAVAPRPPQPPARPVVGPRPPAPERERSFFEQELERASELERKRRTAAGPPVKRVETPEEILNSPLPWIDPRVQQIIDQWLNVATPPLRRIGGAAWHYDQWSRPYNNLTAKKPTQPMDIQENRYSYLWGISPSLNSVSHLTLREYIEKTLRGEAIIAKPISPTPLIPEPPPGTPTGPGVGQAAPLFVTTDLNNQAFDLSKQRSQTVILFFWVSYFAATNDAASSLQDLVRQYSGERIRVVGINSMEGPDKIQAFMAQNGLNYTQLLDAQGRVAGQYTDLVRFPQVFVIDPRGVIKFAGVGNVINSRDFQNAVREAVEESRGYRISEEGKTWPR